MDVGESQKINITTRGRSKWTSVRVRKIDIYTVAKDVCRSQKINIATCHNFCTINQKSIVGKKCIVQLLQTLAKV